MTNPNYCDPNKKSLLERLHHQEGENLKNLLTFTPDEFWPTQLSKAGRKHNRYMFIVQVLYNDMYNNNIKPQQSFRGDGTILKIS